MAWLDPVRVAVQRADAPVRFFFRDDDAGWDDTALLRLLDLFQLRGVPIDLAVIPASLSDPLARELRARRAHAPGLIGLHQHGFAHLNHEPEGRKCEFGPTRSPQAQREDLARGREVLERQLGWCDPIFTPPWNRCTQPTADALLELGFDTLSRDASAGALRLDGLRETPVAVDWCKGPGEVGTRLSSIAQRTAAAVDAGAPVGVMLHHCVMSERDVQQLDSMLQTLRSLPAVHCLLMRDVPGTGRAPGRPEKAQQD
jgi:predicted deacetylase